jgi:hypothetical protein
MKLFKKLKQKILNIKNSHDDPIIEIWRHNFLINKKHLDRSILTIKDLSLENKPYVVLYEGFSLDMHLPAIAAMKNSINVICQDACLYNAIQNRIKPSIVVTLDPSHLVASFWKDIDTSDLILVASVFTHPLALKTWKGKIYFYRQTDEQRLKSLIMNKITVKYNFIPAFENKYFVGGTMLQITNMLAEDNKNLTMLIGYDLCAKDGHMYCKYFLERRASALNLTVEELQEKLKEHYKDQMLDVTDSISTTHVENLYALVIENLVFGKLKNLLVVRTDSFSLLKNIISIPISKLRQYVEDIQ